MLTTMKIHLTEDQKEALELMHDTTRDSQVCDHIKAVLLASEGWTAQMIAQALRICVQKDYRKIRCDHTFSYYNKMYLIDSPLRHSITRQKIEVRKHYDGSIVACFAGRKLMISEVTEPTQPTMYDLEIQRTLDAIELAEKLGNVSEAARLSGCSRETLYKNAGYSRRKAR